MNKRVPGIDWRLQGRSPWREYLEVVGVIAAVTLAGWFAPVTYHVLGHIYLLVVIILSLRVGRGPVFFAAIASGVAWNYVFIPPRLSFSVLDFDDGTLLGTYFVVALIAGQLTARIRRQQQEERRREQRAIALFHLTRAVAEARSLDEAVGAALRQADDLFSGRTALLLAGADSRLAPHPAGTFIPDDRELGVAEWVRRNGHEAGRFTRVSPEAAALHLPLRRAGVGLGVFVVCLPPGVTQVTASQHDLIEGFAAQIALLVEREQLRAAAEREKLLAESDRLHRTLFDSVSHELKTPLAVLRAAAENLARSRSADVPALAAEIATATHRLDRLVANLLSQTRLESGSLKPQLDWCDTRDLVGAVRRNLGPALAAHPVRTRLPEDLPLFMADAPLMEHVLANILLNATLHTPPGTPLLISGGVDPAGGRIFIAVADEGPGIPPELRQNLFQKFQRGNAARAGGLGLGLSIVRGFMQAQGGEVVADDNPGGGARFTLYLPVALHETVPHE